MENHILLDMKSNNLGNSLRKNQSSSQPQKVGLLCCLQLVNALQLTLLAALVSLACGSGCISTSHPPDPLAEWQMLFGRDAEELDKAVKRDYQSYIESLPPKEKMLVDSASIWYFRNSGGRYAIRIEVPANGTWLYHVLIYDGDYKRTQTLTYTGGRYRS